MSIDILSILGIGSAFADGMTTSSGQGGFLSMLPMLALLFLFMYFMVFRPQSKRAKEHRNLVSNIKEDDEVATIGGILGKVKKVTDTHVILNIAENTDIAIQKNAIANVLPKGSIEAVR